LKSLKQADIVVGGDHGQRRLRAVIKLILRNNGNNTINPYSVVIHVRNIECRKDTREVLQKTIGPLLNDSLHLVVDKFIVNHYVNDVTNVILADKPPALNQDSEYNICLATRSFMAGDLSFYHAIIGKENMTQHGALGVNFPRLNGQQKIMNQAILGQSKS
jgi:hypothetical protein